MNLEALALARADEQMRSDSWRTDDEPKPKRTPPAPQYVGLCARCHERRITARNRSGLCRPCHHKLSPDRKAMAAWLRAWNSREAA